MRDYKARLEFLSAIIAVFFLCTHLLSSGRVQAKVRVIPFGDAPIASRLLPDDQVVRISFFAIADPVDYSHETTDQTVRRLVRNAETIALVRLDSVESVLVDQETWIRTKVKGTTVRNIKSGKLTIGQGVEAQWNGGETKIGLVTVQAGTYPVLRTGAEYLLFIDQRGDDLWLSNVYVIDGANVRTAPWSSGQSPATTPFDGKPLSMVLQQLEQAVKR